MSRARILLLGALALSAAACTSRNTGGQAARLRQPSAIAIFHGYSFGDPADLRPFLVIANESRNDLTLVDARVNAGDAAVVSAPVLLRPLALPFPDRPAQLAAASLQDGKPDVLVAVSAGDQVLQLVGTWLPDFAVVPAQEVDLGDDVLAIAALPSAPGTARLAVALAGAGGDPAAVNRLAVVQYRRAAGGTAVEVDTSYDTDGVAVGGVGFHVAGLAAMPGDANHVYAATRDAIEPGVHGVAQIDVSTPGAWTVRALGARAGTRLAAAARVRERLADSVALDPAAFAGQPLVERVYAVLDEGSCGPGKPIDCGVVVLDPLLDTAVRGHSIPDDWSGWMPYRAPIRLPTRVLALAVAGPPVNPPSDLPEEQVYQDGYMRLAPSAAEIAATTGVAVAAGEDRKVHFLDLGRFKVASATAAPVAAAATAGSSVEELGTRISIQAIGAGNQVFPENPAAEIRLTPGYTPDEAWRVAYQAILPGLEIRAAEAFAIDADHVRLAIQIGDGNPGDPACTHAPCAGRVVSQVARLYHPALGVVAGDTVLAEPADIAVIRVKVGGTELCAGAPPLGGPTGPDVPKEFEADVTGILPPSAGSPGGELALARRTPRTLELPPDAATLAAWSTCFDSLAAAATTGLKGLVVTIRSGELVLLGNTRGYAGRPVFGAEYTLEYRAAAGPDEDALAASCPLADWDGELPAPPGVLDCNGAGCDRAVCERLVLARKVRRTHHLAEDCRNDQACLDRYPGVTFPVVNGPALRFQVGNEIVDTSATDLRARALARLLHHERRGVVLLRPGEHLRPGERGDHLRPLAARPRFRISAARLLPRRHGAGPLPEPPAALGRRRSLTAAPFLGAAAICYRERVVRSPGRRTVKTTRHIAIADHLWDAFERMAREMGSEREALVNQAMHVFARLHGFVVPGAPGADEAAPPPLPPEPPARSAAEHVLETAARLEQAILDPTPGPEGEAAAAGPTAGGLLVVREDGTPLEVAKDRFVIGRGRHCDLVIDSGKVSREHAVIVREPEGWFIEDLGSSNGTWHRRERVTRKQLADGDEFFICSEKIRCVLR